MTETVAVVQARLGSSRLPRKVLAELVPGETILERVVTRLKRSSTLDRIVVATTREPEDDEIEQECSRLGVGCVRGDTYDVLARYVAALAFIPGADVIVRVTADCPFVDPDVVDEVVAELRAGHFDYVSNRLPPPYQRTFPVGLDVEAFTTDAILRAHKDADSPHQREHVTPHIYENPSLFRFRVIDLDDDLSTHRWTVDTPEDLVVARNIARAVGDEPFSWQRVLEAVTAQPQLAAPNSSQVQKIVTEVDARSEATVGGLIRDEAEG